MPLYSCTALFLWTELPCGSLENFSYVLCTELPCSNLEGTTVHCSAELPCRSLKGIQLYCAYSLSPPIHFPVYIMFTPPNFLKWSLTAANVALWFHVRHHTYINYATHCIPKMANRSRSSWGLIMSRAKQVAMWVVHLISLYRCGLEEGKDKKRN